MAAESERARLLDEFKEMTGTTDEFAISFLDSSDWHLEQAMELFLGGQGNGLHESRGESISSDEGDDEVSRIMQQHGVDRVTAMAIKQAGGGLEGSPANEVGPDGVRAPILQKRARLFDTFDHEDGAENGMGYLAHDMSGLSVANAFEAQLHLARQTMMQPVQEPPRPSFFAPPPRWMMFTGSFEEARNEAKAKKRWLLVNIQDQQEFQSHVLNRDLWADDMTQSLVRESFLFWQQERTSPEATRFNTLYNPSPPFPHVCILDPRTGERLKILKLKKKETDLRESFFEQATEFLDVNSFDAKSRPAASMTSSSSVSSSTSAPQKTSKVSKEDKELEEAIRASLVVSAPAPAKAKDTARHQTVATKPTQTVMSFLALTPEPVASAEATTVQFKFPDGTKSKRRFLKSASVSMLFSFVIESQKVTKGQRFDLLTSGVPARPLLAELDKSLLEADVLNQNLMVRLLD
jgi:hypothetical protein